MINAADYGAAQRRRRTYIFAYLNKTNYAKKINHFSGSEILHSKGFFAKTFPIVQDFIINEDILNYDDIELISKIYKFGFENSGYMKKGHIYTATTVPVFEKPIPLSSLLQKNVESRFFITKNLDKWKFLKGAKKIERTAKTGFTYYFSEGPIGFPDDISKPARTMLTSESTLNRSTHVIEDPETHKLRLLTPLETERIQGFDDEWTNTGLPLRFRYFCMGNALVVSMITRMAKTLNSIFENE